LTNALQVVRPTPRALTQYEARFHSSAEKYRERASLIRDSIGGTTRTEERTELLDVAAELERLAAELEQMRINKRGFSVFRR
jgi:phosphopantetheine adenylyltransferase